MKYILPLLLIILLYHEDTYGQTNDTREGLYNVGFGAVFGGIGAIINKTKEEKFLPTFVKGMGQGALGGYAVFESKRLLRQFNKTGDFAYIWPSRLLNSAGNSIMENAANNINFYERWHVHIGFNRFELHTKNRWKLGYRFMPLHFVSFVQAASYGPLNFKRSLQTGVFIFDSRSAIESNNPQEVTEVFGIALGNSIVISNFTDNINSTLTHELIHVYQNDSFVVFNPYVQRPLSKWFKKYPDQGIFKYLYLDFNRFTFNSTYWIDDLIKNNYRKRFFEQEAFYYSGQLFFNN